MLGPTRSYNALRGLGVVRIGCATNNSFWNRVEIRPAFSRSHARQSVGTAKSADGLATVATVLISTSLLNRDPTDVSLDALPAGSRLND